MRQGAVRRAFPGDGAAFRFLWSGHDVFLEHKRRYTRPRSRRRCATPASRRERRLLFRLDLPARRRRAPRHPRRSDATQQPLEARRAHQRPARRCLRRRAAAVPDEPPRRPLGLRAGEEGVAAPSSRPMRAIGARESREANSRTAWCEAGRPGRARDFARAPAAPRSCPMPPPWVWYRPSWGVPVETQAAMSMAASTTVAVANGLKRKCVMSRHAPASRRLQRGRLHKPDNAGLLPIWHADLAKAPRAGPCYRPCKGRFLRGRTTIKPLDGGRHPGIEGRARDVHISNLNHLRGDGVHLRFGRAPDCHSSPDTFLATREAASAYMDAASTKASGAFRRR